VFDLSPFKLLVLAVIALVIFGPNELPKLASQAGRMLRELRKIADGAKADLQEGLGPEFSNFDLDDLNPKRFVQKHLLDDVNGDTESVNGNGGSAAPAQFQPDTTQSPADARAEALIAGSLASSDNTDSTDNTVHIPGQNPPFDLEAT
jgi:sec-independent protein translocase protein TatB